MQYQCKEAIQQSFGGGEDAKNVDAREDRGEQISVSVINQRGGTTLFLSKIRK